MCAIVDADVSHEVFGNDRPEAGERLFEWLDSEPFRLAVGGTLLAELNRSPAREWMRQAILAGRVRQETTGTVDRREEELSREGRCLSNDIHVIALAQISGARLLYSNDKDLHVDFKNKRLIDEPRGKVYSTNEDKNFTNAHEKLLNNRNLCRNRCAAGVRSR